MNPRAPSALATAGVLLALAAGGPLLFAPVAREVQAVATAVFDGSPGPEAALRLGRCVVRMLALLLALGLLGGALATWARRRFPAAASGTAADVLGLAALGLLVLLSAPLLRPIFLPPGPTGAVDGIAVARGVQALFWLAAGGACVRAVLRLRGPSQ